jgi:purine-cytosine permease-like protein
MGAVIFVDHYFMRKSHMLDFYAERAGLTAWWPPIAAWLLALVACVAMNYWLHIEIFFLGLPGWIMAGIFYFIMSRAAQNRNLIESVHP